MADTRIPFRDWLPDLAALANPGMTVASGVFPTADGYEPFPGWVTLGVTALTAYARGALAGLDTSGVGYNFAGDATKLYRIGPAGFQDVTRALGAYNCSGTAQWEFLKTRNQVIAVNPYDDIQTIDLGDVNGKFTQLSPDAPRARYIAFIGPQLVVANLFDPQEGELPDAFRYPQLNNPSSWPDPANDDVAIAAQAGRRIIEGDGGRIMAAVSGREVGAIFQERQISRVEYVGQDVVFQVDRVEKTRGLLIPRLAVPYGNKILYCSEDGFYTFDYATSTPVGDSKVSKTFLADVDASYFHRVSAVAHPDQPVIAIGYPATGSAGTPSKVLLWNWALDKWATVAMPHDLLTRVVPLGVTMDNLGYSNLDTVPMSLDEFVSGAGAQQFGAYDTTHTLGTFSGTSVAGTLETGDQEHIPGRLAQVNGARPLGGGADVTLQVAPRFIASEDDDTDEEPLVYRDAARKNRKGICPLRGKGRYHRYRMNLPAGWSGKAIGLDPLYEDAGAG